MNRRDYLANLRHTLTGRRFALISTSEMNDPWPDCGMPASLLLEFISKADEDGSVPALEQTRRMRVTSLLGLNVRSTPDTSRARIGKLQYKAIVEIIPAEGEFVEVVKPIKGYISQKYLEPVK